MGLINPSESGKTSEKKPRIESNDVPLLYEKMCLIETIIETIYGDSTAYDVLDAVLEAYEDLGKVNEWINDNIDTGCDDCGGYWDWR